MSTNMQETLGRQWLETFAHRNSLGIGLAGFYCRIVGITVPVAAFLSTKITDFWRAMARCRLVY